MPVKSGERRKRRSLDSEHCPDFASESAPHRVNVVSGRIRVELHHVELRELGDPRDLADIVRSENTDAGDAVPSMLEALNQAGIEVNTLQEYRPTFDEVFIALMGGTGSADPEA